ncbi:MAG: hypothetical protein WBI44_08410 [Syntrophaceticus sp.]
MSEQEFFELLYRIVDKGAAEKLDISEDDTLQTQSMLDELTSSNDQLDQEEVATVIQGITSNLSEEERRELKEFVEQAAQQLESEQLSDELLKVLYFFLGQS